VVKVGLSPPPMLNNKNLKLISIIKKYINNDLKLYVKFNHYNRKYPFDELMRACMRSG